MLPIPHGSFPRWGKEKNGDAESLPYFGARIAFLGLNALQTSPRVSR
ncbi:hypothetical protein BH10PSE16_BH10PSE16_08720 [soil metagenome]